MQKIMQQMAMSLVSGICFTLAIVITVFVATSFEESNENVDQPSNIVLIDHALQPESYRLTIKGRVKNDSGKEWSYVSLAARIYIGSTLMNECYDGIDYLQVASVRNFRIECTSASGIDLPEGLRYELSVYYATKM